MNAPTTLAAFALLCAAAATAGAQTPDTALATRTRGRATAPVTVYEMSDFECPWCGKFARETLPTIDSEYVATGKVRFVFINFPLPMHANAEPAAELAMCAARQDKFWPVHDLLFRTQDRWSDLTNPSTFFLGLADSAGVDRDRLVRCLDSHATRDAIESDARAAVRTGAHSTPTFYIEGGLMAGAQPISVWRPMLDSIIQAKATHR